MKLDPKEKAKHLVDRLHSANGITNEVDKMTFIDESKKCALVCVDELLDSVPYVNNTPEQVKERMYFMDVRQAIREL